MSSFGGETPVGTFSETVNTGATIYTVPAGKYAKGVLLGDNGTGNRASINIDGLAIHQWDNADNINLEIILLSGQELSASSAGPGNAGVFTGLLYNNPS